MQCHNECSAQLLQCHNECSAQLLQCHNECSAQLMQCHNECSAQLMQCHSTPAGDQTSVDVVPHNKVGWSVKLCVPVCWTTSGHFLLKEYRKLQVVMIGVVGTIYGKNAPMNLFQTTKTLKPSSVNTPPQKKRKEKVMLAVKKHPG